MEYYSILFVIFILFLIEILNRKNLKKTNTIIYIIVSIGLILMAGLRKNIGTDYGSYEKIHSYITSGILKFGADRIEIGYYIINKIIKDFNLMLLTIAIITLTIKFKEIYRLADYKFLSLAIYFSMFFFKYDMGVIRQGIALAIILYSIKYIIEKNKMKFLFCVLVAVLFHTTSIIFIVAYYIGNINISRNKIISFSIISFFIAFTPIGYKVFELLLLVFKKYSIYLESDTVKWVININMIKRIILLIIFTNIIKSRYKDNRKYNVFLNLYFVGVCIFYVFKPISLLSSRGADYYYITEIFLWGIAFKNYKDMIFKYIIYIMLIIYSLYNIYSYTVIGYNGNVPYSPYQSIFNYY